MAEAAAGAQVLLSGHIGSPGVAAGPLFSHGPWAQPGRGASRVVLVVPRTTPELAPVLPRIAALLAETGFGHRAPDPGARKYGVPALVEARGAAGLPEGEVVTVDAYHGKVYQAGWRTC